ncbi:methylated-DNA--[protein]-cysteine S-methyltransferase [Mesorhizobium sp. PUT5]|uniref:methylated-DNA--[protein]-cysteine S-methyltransferase n=1 Tax=Mesorhizobium sp. PUT5 TaxID=3454629 RepID=UPI003FA48D4B
MVAGPISAGPISAGNAVFETALGFFGIAWSEAGLSRLFLPQANREALARRMLRLEETMAEGGARPPWVERLVAAIGDYAQGRKLEFTDVPVDLAGVDDFRLAIYAATRALAYGQTTTYGELAKQAGHAGLARETGAALGANPVPLVIPCHRVLAAGGRIGGFSAPGGSASKERMLALEGVRLGPPPSAQASFGF